MRHILALARQHFALILQENSTYIQAFGVPIILMMVLAAAINENNFADVTIPVDVVDRSANDLSDQFIEHLHMAAAQNAETDTIVICVYGASDNPNSCNLDENATFEDDGQDRVKNGTAAAAVVIPEGFEAALESGEPFTVEYRSNEQLNVQSVARTTVDLAVAQFNASLYIANLGTTLVDDNLNGYTDEETRLTVFNDLRVQAETALDTPPATLQTESTGENVVIGLGARQSVPGMGSMFVLFSLLGIAAFMVEERTNGTLQRLFTVPVPKYQIVFGKILGVFLFGVFQFVVFVLLGGLLGIDWGNDPLAILVLIVAYCLAGTTLGFLLSTFVKTEAQAGTMITLMGLTLAPLGGAWWPLTIVPDFMNTIGHLSPIAWVMEGFQSLLYYNGTLTDVLDEVGVLLIFAAVFAGVAIWNFRYE